MKSVIICDDDNEILNVCSIILKKKGFNVSTASDCETVLDFVKKQRPDAILMDLWIPEMGGEAATRMLKANPKTQDIPVILFSAHNDLELVAKRVSADDFLTKPFEIAQLVDTINRHI